MIYESIKIGFLTKSEILKFELWSKSNVPKLSIFDFCSEYLYCRPNVKQDELVFALALSQEANFVALKLEVHQLVRLYVVMLPTCDFPRLELVGATQSSTFCSTNTVLQAKQYLLSQIFFFDKVQLTYYRVHSTRKCRLFKSMYDRHYQSFWV